MLDKDQTNLIARKLQPKGSEVAPSTWIIRGTGSRLPSALLPKKARPSAMNTVDDKMQTLSLTGHSGIVDYEPSELTLRVRTGTLLSKLSAVLAAEGQMLPFESPFSRKAGTVGGAVSTATAGPARPWRGAVRDAVLGVRLMSGQGQVLNFGGSVMKNVAGFDVSRLVTGAWGTFGPLLDVCFRLLAEPEETVSRCFEFSQQQALEWLIRNQTCSWPFSAAAWEDGLLRIRLAGRSAQVQIALNTLGGTLEDESYWHKLGNQKRPVMKQACCVADVPPAAPAHPDTELIDWGGSRRWFPESLFVEIAHWAKQQGGHCWLWPSANLMLPGEAGLLQQRLKLAFDPDSRFNSHLALQVPTETT